MRNETVTEIAGRRVVLMDSISLITPPDEGTVIVCGSHGGAISGAFAAKHPPALVLFNDAGGGRNAAGIAALAALQSAGIATAAISHMSARIGDARDAWDAGVISACNDAAAAGGVRAGQSVQAAVAAFCNGAGK
jgi:hypothetical protein